MVFYPDLSEEAIETATAEQKEFTFAALKSGESPCYTGILASQLFGPLRKIIIPMEHSRNSRYPLFYEQPKDHHAARNVDFDELKITLYSDLVDDALDDQPLDFHPDFGGNNF